MIGGITVKSIEMENEVGIDSLIAHNFVSKTFMFMAIALFITAMTSFGIYLYTGGVGINQAFIGPATLLELIIVISVSALFRKVSTNIVALMLISYAFLNGVIFSTLFQIFELGSIGGAFLITAGVFGIMGLYGYTTKRDLTKIGTLCMIALFSCIVISFINLFFLRNSAMNTIIDCVLLVVFLGLIAYDIQKIQEYAKMGENSTKMALMFALEIYLDFINVFIRILSLLGKEK